MLLLDVDRTAGGSDRRAILIEIRSFPRCYIEWGTFRRRSSITVPATMNRPLNLNEGIAPLARHSGGKGQVNLAARSPSAIFRMTLACLVPTLDEVVMDIDRGRTGQFYVDIMVLAFAAMPRSNHRVRIEIDPAKESGLRLRAGIDKPALLMLTESRLGAIPPDANGRIARNEEVDMFQRAPEGIRFEVFGFGIGSPEDESNIQTPRRRAIQDVQRRPPTVWHLEVCPHECHRRPNALASSFYGFTNAAKCSLSVDQWPQRIPRTRGIRCRLNNRDGEFAYV